MDKPIIAIAGDPGGANALAPVLLRLRQLGIAPLQALAYREAYPLWNQCGLAPESIDGEEGLQLLEQRLSKASLLVTATSVNGVDRERTAFISAHRLGIPSLALLDFWSNYRLRFVDQDNKLILPDHIAVMDELARADMLAAGFPAAVLIVTGQPAFDALAEARAAFTSKLRADARQALGIEKDELFVLYVSQPFADIYGSRKAARTALGYDEDEVLTLCRQALAVLADQHRLHCVLAIRPHPREPDEKFSETQGIGLRTVIWRKPDRLQAALTVDLVLGMSSVLLYEAACMGCAVVSVQPGLCTDDPLPSNRSGASLAVHKASGLGNALEKALFDEDWRKQRPISFDRKIEMPSATARVIREIEKLLNTTYHRQGSPHAS
jgi:hypothetical protein